jgi:hypothetical protein
MNRYHVVGITLTTVASAALSQIPVGTPSPVAPIQQGNTPVAQASVVSQQPAAVAVIQQVNGRSVLRAGAPVIMKTREALNSKHTKVGHMFELEVVEPVVVGGYTVIPVGARAVGEVTRVVKKGAFGKSGKIDTELRYVMLGSDQVRISGRANDAGKGGTAGTVAVAVLAGVFSAFVTGQSADFPVGTSMTGYTMSDTLLAIEPTGASR